jgi:hypothetical protein
MTPAGGTANARASFVLQDNGDLWKFDSAGPTFLSSGIGFVSDQGFDNQGRVMVDVVTWGGEAYEYHDGGGWTDLGGGFSEAVAGQGVSYLLSYPYGAVYRYEDAIGGTGYFLTAGATKIDAGTDYYGVNKVDVLYTNGDLSEYSDEGGWTSLASNVSTMSAGQQGVTAFVISGYAFRYEQGNFYLPILLIGENVSQVAAGTDESGAAMYDLVYQDGSASEYRAGTATSSSLGDSVWAVSKGRLGLADVVLSYGGDSYEHTLAGWNYLLGSSVAAV